MQPASDGLPVEDALALLAYLVTCAELCTHEPWHYGQLRLIDAAGRLARALDESGAAGDRAWLGELQRTIQSKKELVMYDFDGFQEFLRRTPRTVAAELRKEGW
jgi:uncharacterized protein DUF6092